jgi:hypothetical protein
MNLSSIPANDAECKTKSSKTQEVLMTANSKFIMAFGALAFVVAGVAGTARADTSFPTEARGETTFFDAQSGAVVQPFDIFQQPSAAKLRAMSSARPFIGQPAQPDAHWGPAQDATSPGA